MMYRYLLVGAVAFLSIHCLVNCSTESPKENRSFRNVTRRTTTTTTTTTTTLRPKTKGEKWLATEKIIKNIMSYATRRLIRMLDPEDISKISSQCFSHILKTAVGLRQTKAWAFKMIDALGKVPNGVFSGGLTALGDFDSCLSVNASGLFQGKNCIVELMPPVPETKPITGIVEVIPEWKNASDPESLVGSIDELLYPHYSFFVIRTAACVPSTCSENDVEFIARKTLEIIQIEWDVKITNCQVKEPVKFEIDDYISITVVSVMFLFLVSGTLVDIVLMNRNSDKTYRQDSGIFVRTMLCFSICWNTEKILQKDTSPDSVHIFYGMKVVTILWVVLNHAYAFMPAELYSAGSIIKNIGNDIFFQPVMNGFASVDTFFFISATLLMYGRMRMKTEKISIFMYIFHRLWRLTPPILFLMAFELIVYRMGSGPFWHQFLGLWVRNCQKKWWTNLLYFNNFYADDENCVGWTWFVAADTQLYIFALIVILPIRRRPRLALGTLAVLSTISIAATVLNHIHYQLPALMTVSNARHMDDLHYFVKYGYFGAHLHAFVYFVGMATGYVIYHRSNIHFSRRTNVACWIISVTSGLAVIYSAYAWYNFIIPSLPVATTYVTVIKIIWAFALAWVTISCFAGHGGFITKLLSWTPLGPISRLTYTVYLVHPIIQMAYISSSRVPFQSDHRTFVYYYLGTVLASYITAYFFSMLFEAPFLALEKVLFRRVPATKAMENGHGKLEEVKDCSSENGVTKFEGKDSKEIYGIPTTELVGLKQLPA